MIFKYLFLIFFLGCSKVDLGAIDNLNNGIVHIIGHGGMGFQSTDNSIPENSYAAHRKAVLGHNADGVETDVQLTYDNKLVLYHNSKLQDTTACVGCIIEHNLENLTSCLYRNNRYFNRYSTEKVTSLSRVLDLFKNLKRKPYVYLDVKTDTPCNLPTTYSSYINNYAQALVDIIQSYSAHSWVIVTTKSEDLLNSIQSKDSNVILYFEHNDPSVAITTATSNAYEGVTLDYELTSKGQNKTAHNNNLRVVLFGVKSTDSTIKALKTDPDAIMTDNIVLMQRILTHR